MDKKAALGIAFAVASGALAFCVISSCDFQAPHKKPKNPIQHVLPGNKSPAVVPLLTN